MPPSAGLEFTWTEVHGRRRVGQIPKLFPRISERPADRKRQTNPRFFHRSQERSHRRVWRYPQLPRGKEAVRIGLLAAAFVRLDDVPASRSGKLLERSLGAVQGLPLTETPPMKQVYDKSAANGVDPYAPRDQRIHGSPSRRRRPLCRDLLARWPSRHWSPEFALREGTPCKRFGRSMLPAIVV